MVIKDMGGSPYAVNIDAVTRANPNYRNILWTGTGLQVSLMSLQPGEDIGLEVHPDNDQFFRIEQGQGVFQAGPTKDNLSYSANVESDWAAMVPKGTWHNITNTGSQQMKLYTIYGPAHHPFGTVHATKQIAEAAEAAEHAVG